MRKGAVGLRHLVRVVALLDHVARVVVRVEQLGGDRLGHAHAAAAGRVGHEPAQRQRELAGYVSFSI